MQILASWRVARLRRGCRGSRFVSFLIWMTRMLRLVSAALVDDDVRNNQFPGTTVGVKVHPLRLDAVAVVFDIDVEFWEVRCQVSGDARRDRAFGGVRLQQVYVVLKDPFDGLCHGRFRFRLLYGHVVLLSRRFQISLSQVMRVGVAFQEAV